MYTNICLDIEYAVVYPLDPPPSIQGGQSAESSGRHDAATGVDDGIGRAGAVPEAPLPALLEAGTVVLCSACRPTPWRSAPPNIYRYGAVKCRLPPASVLPVPLLPRRQRLCGMNP